MKSLSFAAGEILFAVIWIVIRVSLCVYRRRIDWKRELKLLLMYVNIAVIIRYTFYPFYRLNGSVRPLLFSRARVFPLRVNLIPFVSITNYDLKRDVYINIIGNVAMFIPTGVVLPVVYRNMDKAWKVIGTGALMSLCIELIQLPFYGRASDVDDLILNTAGCAVGYVIYVLARSRVMRSRKPEQV